MISDILYLLTRLVFIITFKIYFRLSVRGAKNVPRKGAVLIVANHASNLDPPFMAAASPRISNFLSKEEVFDVPFIGWYSRKIGHAHPLSRDRMDRQALRGFMDMLRRGEVLVLFPEGTRTRDGSLGEPKPGASMLARSTDDLVIVPAYIDGSFEAMGRGKSFPRPHKVTITFGEGYRLSDASGEKVRGEQHKLVAEEMMKRIAALAPAPSEAIK